ncbi:MAG: RpiB/LacA/LacB family sugar-phosphate isomerase [Actinobacteria bacterium]|nr:RpiB/LacA/LacB family sugar-phosphate isomerase [Actinomycetota bacterium]MCL6104996.1 RpiB/LacA/LacB family sugar-phosphate isomerase [Actinomycetota bacterium]
MKIAFGSDTNTPLVQSMISFLVDNGHQVTAVAMGEVWTDVAKQVAESVTKNQVERGVVCCWTGTGVSIAANKVPGVRAALCTDAQTAAGARKYNDANVLAISLRLTSEEVAKEILEAFLNVKVDPAELEIVNRLL